LGDTDDTSIRYYHDTHLTIEVTILFGIAIPQVLRYYRDTK